MCLLIAVLIKCIDCCDLIFTVGIAVIYVHRVKLYCIDYSLHRLPMRASKLLSPGLITWTITYRPICESEGQRGTLSEEGAENTLGARRGPGDGPTKRTDENGQNGLPRREAAERTPSYRRTPVVGCSMLILPELRDVSVLSLYVSLYTV